MSERPKERASKAREGSRPPWVQIPPLPPFAMTNARPSPRSDRVLLPASRLPICTGTETLSAHASEGERDGDRDIQ